MTAKPTKGRVNQFENAMERGLEGERKRVEERFQRAESLQEVQQEAARQRRKRPKKTLRKTRRTIDITEAEYKLVRRLRQRGYALDLEPSLNDCWRAAIRVLAELDDDAFSIALKKVHEDLEPEPN